MLLPGLYGVVRLWKGRQVRSATVLADNTIDAFYMDLPASLRFWNGSLVDRSVISGSFVSCKLEKPSVRCIYNHNVEDELTAMTFDPWRIFCGYASGMVAVFRNGRYGKGRQVYCFRQQHQGRVHCLVTPRSRAFLVTGSQDRTVRVWDYRQGTEKLCLRGHAFPVAWLSMGGDSVLISGDESGEMRVWDLPSGEIRQTFVHPTRTPKTILFSHGGDRFLCSDRVDNNLSLWACGAGQFAKLDGWDDCSAFAWDDRAIAPRNSGVSLVADEFTLLLVASGDLRSTRPRRSSFEIRIWKFGKGPLSPTPVDCGFVIQGGQLLFEDTSDGL